MSKRSGLRARLLSLFAMLAVSALFFLLIEGAASVLYGMSAIRSEWRDPIAERIHTEYDPLLGWINRPDLQIDDMYGPGIALRTNAQRFREATPTPNLKAPGSRRLICSGDSFTLGYGVANDQTYCKLLEGFGRDLTTVNMGQGGYGIDQAYLWYQRDGVQLEHDVQLLSFITYDFDRMRDDNFLGYGKPQLRELNGALVVENTPVPEQSFRFPQLSENVQLLRQLRSVGLVLSLFEGGADSADAARLSEADTRRVSRVIFETLHRENERAGRIFAAVYLPRGKDAKSQESDGWRAFLREESARTGMLFIDLVEDFRLLPEDLRPRFFTHKTWGHYSVLGNAWVAKTLNRKLRAHSEVASHLGPPASP